MTYTPKNSGQLDKSVVPLDYSTQETATNALLALYDQKIETGDGLECSQRIRHYDVTQGDHAEGYNKYYVSKADQGESLSVQIPLWTRNKTMIENSGYTGNNPYEEYERKAIIRITAKFEGREVPLTKEVPVYQVRRLVNPKAVWRSYSDNNSFLVHIMTKNSPTDTKYIPYTSDGSWDASIESGATGFCYITTNPAATTGTKTIEGKTGSEIKFYVKFNGTTTSGNSNGCVININYNGGSCTHKVLVRQGYDEAVPIYGNTPKWSSFNLFSCEGGTNGQATANIPATLTKSPLAMGSFFKRLNYSSGILISNNNEYGPLVNLSGNSLKLARKDNNGKWQESSWNDISYYSAGYLQDNFPNQISWGTFRATPSGSSTPKTYRVPTYAEYKSLDNAEFAVGIVYADGATETLDTFDAYGFEDGENLYNPSLGSRYGTRGVIVYNSSTGNQILFPVGKYGMARRTQFNLGTVIVDGVEYTSGANNNPRRGYLRYGDTPTPLTNENDLWRPIPYNIPECPGAIYWINRTQYHGHANGKDNCGGWDMNYFSLDFSSYTNNCRYDAMPIKLVTD